MAKILVTGGAGFIGSHLVDALIERGHLVVVIDNDLSGLKRKNLNNPKAKFYELDICDFKGISPFFEDIDFVFHLAAIARVPISVKDPLTTSRVNIIGTINVFKAGLDAKVKRIIFSSSSSVYGDQEKLPLREDMIPYPISPYGLQKLVGEQFAKLFTSLYKIPIVSLRYFNVYGPRAEVDSANSLVIGKFLRLKKEGKPLTVFGDGRQTRGYSYVDDVVEANLLAMSSKKIKGGEVINIGSENSHSLNHLTKLIGGEVKKLPPRTGDVRDTKADISLAKELLGWYPKISLERGLEKTKNWLNYEF